MPKVLPGFTEVRRSLKAFFFLEKNLSKQTNIFHGASSLVIGQCQYRLYTFLYNSVLQGPVMSFSELFSSPYVFSFLINSKHVYISLYHISLLFQEEANIYDHCQHFLYARLKNKYVRPEEFKDHYPILDTMFGQIYPICPT